MLLGTAHHAGTCVPCCANVGVPWHSPGSVSLPWPVPVSCSRSHSLARFHHPSHLVLCGDKGHGWFRGGSTLSAIQGQVYAGPGRWPLRRQQGKHSLPLRLAQHGIQICCTGSTIGALTGMSTGRRARRATWHRFAIAWWRRRQYDQASRKPKRSGGSVRASSSRRTSGTVRGSKLSTPESPFFHRPCPERRWPGCA